MRNISKFSVIGCLTVLALAGCKQENNYPTTEATTEATTTAVVPVAVPVPGPTSTVVVPVPGPTVTATPTPETTATP